MVSGFAHIGLSTHNMEATLDFYCNILDCRLVVDERIEISDGGEIRQTCINVGEDQYLVFMQAKGVKTISENYDTSINHSLGVPQGMYHYALKVDSLENLKILARRIEGNGIEVSEVTDLDYIKSIFFEDPNGLQLEASVKIREFSESDVGRVTTAKIAT